MVSVVILTVITAGLWRMTRGGALSFLRAQRQAEAISNGERALRGFGRNRGILQDIRRCSAVTAVQADRLSLTCPDGALEYFRQGNDLVQVVAGSTATVARNITALSFRYFKIQDGLVSLATAPALAASIEISGLRVVNRDISYELASSARLRNR